MVGGTTDRGVVAACSYEARAFGVHSGMSMKMARRICPYGIVIRGDSSKYFKYSKTITEILKESVPKLEKASVDEFYFDMTGMDKLVHTVHGDNMFFGCFTDSKGKLFDTVYFPQVVERSPALGRGAYIVKGTVVQDFDVPSIEVVKMERIPWAFDQGYMRQ